MRALGVSADLDKDQVKEWAKLAHQLQLQTDSESLQRIINDMHTVMLKLKFLAAALPHLEESMGWTVYENQYEYNKMMNRYMEDLEDLRRDSRCLLLSRPSERYEELESLMS